MFFFKISDPTQLCSKHLLTRDWALVEPHNLYFKTFFLFVRCVAARLGWYQKVACNASISYPRTKDTLLQNVKTKKSFLLPPLLLRSRGSSKTIIVLSRLAVTEPASPSVVTQNQNHNDSYEVGAFVQSLFLAGSIFIKGMVINGSIR